MELVLKILYCCLLLIISTSSLCMNYVQTITSDEIEFQIDKEVTYGSKTLSNVVNDSENILNDKFQLPISSTNLMVILPLLDIISERNNETNEDNLTTRLVQEKNVSFQHCVELLNAANFLNSTPLINFFLQRIALTILKESEINSLDQLCSKVASLDIPSEISTMLGQKIIEKYFKGDRNPSVKEYLTGKKVLAFAFSYDKSCFAYTEFNKGTKVIDVKNGYEIAHFNHFENSITHICFSRDGLKVVLVSREKMKSMVTIFCLESKKRLESSTVPDYIINALSFSPSSKILLASTTNNSLIKLNVRNNRKDLRIFEYENEAKGPFVYNKKGEIVSKPDLLCKKRIAFWSLSNNKLTQEMKKLNAEHALVFIEIAKKAAYSTKLNFSNNSFAQNCYSDLVKNAAFEDCLKKHVIIDKHGMCNIS